MAKLKGISVLGCGMTENLRVVAESGEIPRPLGSKQASGTKGRVPEDTLAPRPMSDIAILQQLRLFNVLGLRDSLRYTSRQLLMGSKLMEATGQYPCSRVCLLDSWSSTTARLFAVQG
jgi:hypothetical protein